MFRCFGRLHNEPIEGGQRASPGRIVISIGDLRLLIAGQVGSEPRESPPMERGEGRSLRAITASSEVEGWG